MRIFHTRNREGAVRELAGAHERVLVRNKNLLWNPLRLRRRELADLNPFIVLNPPEFDAQLDAWNRTGGVMIFDRAYVPLENVGAHSAQLLSECPVSRADLDRYTEGTSDVAVIYRPPNWIEHRRWVAAYYPSADSCQRLYDLVQASPYDVKPFEVLGIAPGAQVLPDEDATAALGVRGAHVACIRTAMLPPRAFKPVKLVALRIAPREQPLAEAYAFIARECPEVEGVRLVMPSVIGKKIRHWRVALRMLERRGAIALKGTVFLYWLGEIVPHWPRLDARQRHADERLEEMIALVEQAPEFNRLDPPPPRSPARKGRSRSTSAV